MCVGCASHRVESHIARSATNMSGNSKISWTHHTFNPWWGCEKISEGCKNCYADNLSSRYGFDVWGPSKPRRTFGAEHWLEPLLWNRKAESARIRARVFCGSMCDWLEQHPTMNAERPKLWSLIRQTPCLDWLLLTKRPERLAENLPNGWGTGYPNVWLGVTVESDRYTDRFNRYLAPLSAAVRFVSCEPALGPVTRLNWPRLDWLIYGAESGAHCRPHNVQWARDVKARCSEHGIAFFYKQGNGVRAGQDTLLDGELVQQFPNQLHCRAVVNRAEVQRLN